MGCLSIVFICKLNLMIVNYIELIFNKSLDFGFWVVGVK